MSALSGHGSNFSLGASAYKRIISNNSCAHDEQRVNPGQVKGFDSVLCKLTIADSLSSSVKVLATLTLAEADRRDKSTGWHCISASQGLARQ